MPNRCLNSRLNLTWLAIVIGEQFHGVSSSEDSGHTFRHHLSVASSARSDKQRRDALVFLTDQIALNSQVKPLGTHAIISKLLPLISDTATPVRAQLLKLLQTLSPQDVRYDAERILIFVRAGMTHLSADVSGDALSVLEWLLGVAKEDAVSCPGGWVKTLKTFCSILGWNAGGGNGWTAGAKSTIKSKDATTRARQLGVLATFLRSGLKAQTIVKDARSSRHQYSDHLFLIPEDPQPFAYMNLFGEQRDEDGRMYSSREERQGVFYRRFQEAMEKGLESAKKEGGACGRSAAVVDEAMRNGMVGFETK